jgi:hypothetical protein
MGSREELCLCAGLELESVLRLGGKRHTQLEQLDKGLAELLEENVAVLGVAVDVLLEFLVLDEGQVGGEHHQGLGGVVGVLGRTVPLLPRPLLLYQEAEELVGEDGGTEVPRTVETGAVLVSTAQGVGTGQGDHLAVIEAHTSENFADVLVVLGSVWQTSVRGAGGEVPICTARSPGDRRTLHLLDGAGTGKGPEVGVRDPWELFYERVRESEQTVGDINIPLTGSRKSRAILRPALAPWSDSGANLMVAPLLPPVPVSLS